MLGFFKLVCLCLAIFVTLLLLETNECQGANILFYVTLAYSHRQSIEPLAHKLVENGHSVTFFSCEGAAKPNPKFKLFCPKKLNNFLEVHSSEYITFFKIRCLSRYLNGMPNILISMLSEPDLCYDLYNTEDVKEWISSQKFDLVILETISQKCSYALAYKFGAPTISFSPSGFTSFESERWGFPGETSWAPALSTPNMFTKERTFFDRLFQEIYVLSYKFVFDWFVIPRLDQKLREDLELPDMPSIKELEERTSLFFVNLYHENDFPRSLPPFVVPIGGLTCDLWDTSKKKTAELPKVMEDFINGAGEDGFIFISFGSFVLHMSYFQEEQINLFFDVIRGRKTRFLWKWDIDPPKNLPDNVLTAKWFPQQRLLSHPKIKGFISHGGLMSYQQSSCYGVPMIILPVFFDQPYIGLLVQLIHQMGIHLEFSDLTRESLATAIDLILTDKTYSDNAKIVQKRFLDRPMSPIETASYWTEYVLRHKNTSHLKPTLGMNQYWWQRRLLDVWLFILILIIVSWWLFYKVGKMLFHRKFKPFLKRGHKKRSISRPSSKSRRDSKFKSKKIR